MTAAPDMTPARALEICKGINARAFLAMGISEKPQLPSLAGVTLAEMLQAAELVRWINETTPSENGKRMVYAVPADRLIAAVYVGLTYEPGSEPIAMEPRMILGEWQMNAVAVLDVTRQTEIDDPGVAA